MKHRNRIAGTYVVGAGLAALLVSAPFARAQNNRLMGSQPTVEPTQDTYAGPPPTEGTRGSQTPESVIRSWPDASRAAAGEMIGKYGEPTRFTDDALVWIGNAPWRKTVVYRNERHRFLGSKGDDFIEQTIVYRVPNEKVEDLKRFDRRLEVNESRGLLSARSESESMNFLALNLADEIVTDKRTVEDAREFYDKTERLSQAGKSSAYTDGLMFPSREEGLRVNEDIDSNYGRSAEPRP